MKVVDLKRSESKYIQQYVDLRNHYQDFLLCNTVSLESTVEWLERANVVVRAILCEDKLLGASVLYYDRDGEVAFFALEQGKGIGSALLKAIEEVAIKQGIPLIWAWMLEDNNIARRAFEKNGFVLFEHSSRVYNAQLKRGVVFRKILRIV